MERAAFTRDQLVAFLGMAGRPIVLWFGALVLFTALLKPPTDALGWIFLLGIPVAYLCGIKLELDRTSPTPARRPPFAIHLLSVTTGERLVPSWGRALAVTLRALKPLGAILGVAILAASAGDLVFSLAFGTLAPGQQVHLDGAGLFGFGLAAGAAYALPMVRRAQPRLFATPVTDFYVVPVAVDAAASANATTTAPAAGIAPAPPPPVAAASAPSRPAAPIERAPSSGDDDLEELRRRVAEAERRKALHDEEAAAREREKAALRRRLEELEKG